MIPVSTNYPFSDPQDERSGLRGCTDSLEQIQTMHRIQRENRSFLDPFRYNRYPAKRKVPIMTSRLNEPVIMLILPMAPGKLSNISVRQRRVCTVTQRQRRRLALGFLPYWRARRHSRRRSLDRGARPDFQSRLGFIARSRSFVRSFAPIASAAWTWTNRISPASRFSRRSPARPREPAVVARAVDSRSHADYARTTGAQVLSTRKFSLSSVGTR